MPASMFDETELHDLRQAFALFDKDGDGGITQQEMAAVMAGFGQELDPSVLAPLFRGADDNRDGRLQWEEFVNLVQRLDTEDEGERALHRSLVIFLEILGR